MRAAFALLGVALLATPAFAQEEAAEPAPEAAVVAPAEAVPEADPSQRARELFDEARRARDEGRLSDSLDLLRQSLEILPRSSTALNLVRLHLAMGRPTLARDLIASLMAGEYGLLGEGQRGRMRLLEDQVSERIASLAIEVHGTHEFELRVDGLTPEITMDEERSLVFVDPGEHVVRAEAYAQHQERTVQLRAGEREDIRFEFAPPVAVTPRARTEATSHMALGDPRRRRRRRRSNRRCTRHARQHSGANARS